MSQEPSEVAKEELNFLCPFFSNFSFQVDHVNLTLAL